MFYASCAVAVIDSVAYISSPCQRVIYDPILSFPPLHAYANWSCSDAGSLTSQSMFVNITNTSFMYPKAIQARSLCVSCYGGWVDRNILFSDPSFT